jgi:hypothetical protein
MPDYLNLACRCGARWKLNRAHVPAGPARATCRKCQHVIEIPAEPKPHVGSAMWAEDEMRRARRVGAVFGILDLMPVFLALAAAWAHWPLASVICLTPHLLGRVQFFRIWMSKARDRVQKARLDALNGRGAS